MADDLREGTRLPDPELVALGQHVRRLRHGAGLTQEGLAATAGLHWTYVGQIERGQRNVTFKNILRLARGLGVEPASVVQDWQEAVRPPPFGRPVRSRAPGPSS